ncbi:MAG: HAD-IIIA family hydrolase, partial [Proteobacteria bacterium]
VEDFEVLEYQIPPLKKFYNEGYLLIVVTNQSGIAKGYFTELELAILINKIRNDMAVYGIDIAGFYYCPHFPDTILPEFNKSCSCRKPAAGMILQEHRQVPRLPLLAGGDLRGAQPGNGDRVVRDPQGRRCLCTAGPSVPAGAHRLHAAGQRARRGAGPGFDTWAVGCSARGRSGPAGLAAPARRQPRGAGLERLCDLHLRFHRPAQGCDQRACRGGQSPAVDAGRICADGAGHGAAENPVQF